MGSHKQRQCEGTGRESCALTSQGMQGAAVRRGKDPELQRDRDPTLLQTFVPQTNEKMNLFQVAKFESFPTAVTGNRWSFLLRYIALCFFSPRS